MYIFSFLMDSVTIEFNDLTDRGSELIMTLTQNNPSLQEALKSRILILDGAMGTMIQQANLTAEDFGGEELDGCNELLVLTRPDVISGIHEAYLEAGADIIETNTFGSTAVVLSEYDIPEKAREIQPCCRQVGSRGVRQIFHSG